MIIGAGALVAGGGGPVTTRILDIAITGNDCEKLPREISVVMADKDGTEDRFTIPRIELCRWKGNAPRTFDASLTHFSLRLIRARTDCRLPDTYQESGVASLAYSCCIDEPVHQITVRAESAIKDRSVAVSYLRRVPKRSDESVDCIEHGDFRETGTIDHVQFQSETIRLQIGYKEPKPASPGLRVRVPNVKDGKKVNFDVQLDRDDVVATLAEQRVQVESGGPTLSSNAIDIDVKKLRDVGLKTLKFTVQ